MPGMKDQIQKYKAAVGKRNVGSQPSNSQVSNAKNTAIGKMRGTISSTNKNSSTNSIGKLSVTKATRGKPRGSWEGYTHAPTAYISPNNSGYNKKSSQHARNTPKRNIVNITPHGSVQANSFKVSRTFDSRRSGNVERNSICKLNNIIKKANNLI